MIRTREVCRAKQLSNAERKGYSSRKAVERSKRNIRANVLFGNIICRGPLLFNRNVCTRIMVNRSSTLS